LAKSARVLTIAAARIVEWPRPQSSVQRTSYSPTFVGVIASFVSSPPTSSPT
jgi:hypothetical protein